MLASLLGQSADFGNTPSDWHAIAPEVVLAGVALLIVLADSVFLERARPFIPGLAGLGFLAALIPVLTLAMSSTEVSVTPRRSFEPTGTGDGNRTLPAP